MRCGTSSKAAAVPATVSGEPVPAATGRDPGKAAPGGDPRARRPAIDSIARRAGCLGSVDAGGLRPSGTRSRAKARGATRVATIDTSRRKRRGRIVACASRAVMSLSGQQTCWSSDGLARTLSAACSAVAIIMFGASAAQAQAPQTPDANGITNPSIATSLPQSGDPYGTRKWLSDHGITYTLIYTNDVLSNLSGGSKRGTIDQGKLEAMVTID